MSGSKIMDSRKPSQTLPSHPAQSTRGPSGLQAQPNPGKSSRGMSGIYQPSPGPAQSTRGPDGLQAQPGPEQSSRGMSGIYQPSPGPAQSSRNISGVQLHYLDPAQSSRRVVGTSLERDGPQGTTLERDSTLRVRSSQAPSSRMSPAQSVRNTVYAPSIRAGGLSTIKESSSRFPSTTPREVYTAPNAPSKIPSILVTSDDVVRASRQSGFTSMGPDEQVEQEHWALKKINEIGSCPEGYKWARMINGFQCIGKGHCVTDALLEEGKGGVYSCKSKNWGEFEGPYYRDPKGNTGKSGKLLWLKAEEIERLYD